MSGNPTLEQCVQLPINQDVLLEVTEKAKDWAIMHGAAMRSKTNFSPDSLNVSDDDKGCIKIHIRIFIKEFDLF